MNNDFPITIYHNPKCGTSRNTLEMIRAAGYEPEIIEYMKAGWTKKQLKDLLGSMTAAARDILRAKELLAQELALSDESTAEDAILDAMVDNPVLVNRPIVITPKGVKLCRPSEVVLSLLENAPDTFTKEDGEVIKSR